MESITRSMPSVCTIPRETSINDHFTSQHTVIFGSRLQDLISDRHRYHLQHFTFLLDITQKANKKVKYYPDKKGRLIAETALPVIIYISSYLTIP